MATYNAEDDTRTQTLKSNLIKEYLLNKNVEVWKELCELRSLGWQSTEADKHFVKQRAVADNSRANKKVQQGFFRKMLLIADELNRATNAFIPNSASRNTSSSRLTRLPQPRLFDACMAPGAFSEYFLRQNPGGIVDGLSLPVEKGGHELLISRTDSRTGRPREIHMAFTDVTLHETFLPRDMSIPPTFPDMSHFTSNPPLPIHLQPRLPSHLYDLAICDGQTLRTHKDAELRTWEPGRLLLAQLILGLTHIKVGGSMLILLHRVEQWPTLALIYRFNRISNITLYKPTSSHATRSSFYLVAQNINPDMEFARNWVEYMRQCWYRMTFEGQEGRGEGIDGGEDLEVEKVLEEFGEKLVEMGSEVWRKQRDALRTSTWIGRNTTGASADGSVGRSGSGSGRDTRLGGSGVASGGTNL